MLYQAIKWGKGSRPSSWAALPNRQRSILRVQFAALHARQTFTRKIWDNAPFGTLSCADQRWLDKEAAKVAEKAKAEERANMLAELQPGCTYGLDL